MTATIAQQIIGELITKEKYSFIEGRLIASIVNDALSIQEKIKHEYMKLRENMAVQELTDAIHEAHENDNQIINISLGSARIIKELI